MKRRWSPAEIERMRSGQYHLEPCPVTRERPGSIVRPVRPEQHLERATMAQNQNVTVMGAPWALILQVILLVCWYVVPGMQGASPWVIFLPIILGAGFLAMFLFAAVCVIVVAVVGDRARHRR